MCKEDIYPKLNAREKSRAAFEQAYQKRFSDLTYLGVLDGYKDPEVNKLWECWELSRHAAVKTQ